MVIMTVRNLPDDLHKRFKVLCVEDDVSMNGKIIDLIREHVEQREKKKPKK